MENRRRPSAEGGRASGRRTKTRISAKTRRTIFFVFVALLAALVVWLVLYFFVINRPINVADLEEGEMPGYAAEELVTEAAGKGEAEDPSQFSFDINTNPVFERGGAAGPLGIANPWKNTYLMHVEIVEEGTGRRLYSSGTLRPGEAIERDALLVSLGKGDHYATAEIYAYDPVTNELIVRTQAGMTITIEN